MQLHEDLLLAIGGDRANEPPAETEPTEPRRVTVRVRDRDSAPLPSGDSARRRVRLPPATTTVVHLADPGQLRRRSTSPAAPETAALLADAAARFNGSPARAARATASCAFVRVETVDSPVALRELTDGLARRRAARSRAGRVGAGIDDVGRSS